MFLGLTSEVWGVIFFWLLFMAFIYVSWKGYSLAKDYEDLDQQATLAKNQYLRAMANGNAALAKMTEDRDKYYKHMRWYFDYIMSQPDGYKLFCDWSLSRTKAPSEVVTLEMPPDETPAVSAPPTTIPESKGPPPLPQGRIRDLKQRLEAAFQQTRQEKATS